MDDIMRDTSAEAGGQPVAERSRALLDAGGGSVEAPVDVTSEGAEGAGRLRGMVALLRSRAETSMSATGPDSRGEDKLPPEQPRQLSPAAGASPDAGSVPEAAPSDQIPADEIPADEISAEAAAAALAAEEGALEFDAEIEGEDGLPPVPELVDPEAVARVMFVLLLSQREGLSLFRIAQACNVTQKAVEAALPPLQQWLDQAGLPVEVVRTGESLKLLSRPDVFAFLQRLRGVKKMEKLSPAALETLAVIAYRQPVMRAEIEAIRGVKAGPMLRTLLQHKLVRVTGRADVPGRPLQYGTTEHFLERFGLTSLQELPSVKEWKQIS